MPSRRAVLATAGAALASGCANTGVGCNWGITVRATPVDSLDVYVSDLTDAHRSLAETGLAEGSASVTLSSRTGPFRDGELFDFRGRYYEARELATSTETIPALRVDARSREESESPPGDAVAYESLPAADRHALDALLRGPEDEFDRVATDLSTLPPRYRGEDVLLPYPNGTDGSHLRSLGPTWIGLEERYFHVEAHSTDTMGQRTYRYEFTDVGDTREALRDHVVPESPTVLADLPADQRAVLEDAIDGEYETCEERPGALAAIAERLGDRQAGYDPARQDWYVAYEGTTYGLQYRRWEAEF